MRGPGFLSPVFLRENFPFALNHFRHAGKLRGVKIFAVLLPLLCAFYAQAVVLNGHDYRPLADWAAENHFREMNDGRGERLTLTNRMEQRLVFEKNSVTAEINGVKVALSFPVALDKQGIFYVARFDLAKTIEPLIFSPAPARRKISTICIDPGHGGKDPGKQVGGHDEKYYTLLLAGELRRQLLAAGFKVVLTRERDQFVDLSRRPEIANRRGADLFVSLHFNATDIGRNEVAGPQTYCITPVGASSTDAEGRGAGHAPTIANRAETKSLLLAYQVHRALVKSLGVPDRSVRRALFEVLRGALMPAILIEGGYMTNPSEARKIYNDAYRHQMAAAIVRGILNYQKDTAAVAATNSLRKASAAKK